MNRLQYYIKQKRFNINTMDGNTGWREGKMDLTFRITHTVTDSWSTDVNIYVKGKIEDRKVYDDNKASMRPATDVVYRPRETSWDTNWRRRSTIWGDQYHKNIRTKVRHYAEKEIQSFFKLIGKTKRVNVNKVHFEK